MIWRRSLACSFCGRDADSVARLLGGPGVYICDRCVEICNAILDGHETEFTPRQGSDEELLGALKPAESAVDSVVDLLHARVAELRERGVSWQRIGAALGVSRQAAWERFSGG